MGEILVAESLQRVNDCALPFVEKKKGGAFAPPFPFYRVARLSVRAHRSSPAAAAAEPPEQPGKQRPQQRPYHPGRSWWPAAAEQSEPRTAPEPHHDLPG